MSDRPLNARTQKMFAIIETYQSSGLSQKAFCQSEGLALSTFQYWLTRYRKHHLAESNRPLFVELKACPEQSRRACPEQSRGVASLPSEHVSDSGVTINYPNGVQVKLGTAVELSLLTELIRL